MAKRLRAKRQEEAGSYPLWERFPNRDSNRGWEVSSAGAVLEPLRRKEKGWGFRGFSP